MERENQKNDNANGGGACGDAAGAAGAKKVKNRCLVCNKKLGLVGGFTCKCGGMFCGAHRSENLHDCSFNFAEAAMSGLSGRLVVVGGEKIDKIGV